MRKSDSSLGEPLADDVPSIIKFANPALDREIGGMPVPSLTLIEGPNDAGKSVVSQQLAFGGLQAGLTVRYITTENTFTSLMEHMESLAFSVTRKLIEGRFKITILHTQGLPWDAELAGLYLGLMSRFIIEDRTSKLLIVDSLTPVAAQASEDSVLKFFSELRNSMFKNRRCIVVTLHPYALTQDVLVRIRSMCDGHFNLSIKEARNKLARSLEVSKLRGAKMKSIGLLTFDVEPELGIKITPLTSAKG